MIKRKKDTLIKTEKNVSVLIVLLGRIGDVIFTLPSVIALKKLRPEIEIDWVVEDRCADLLVGHPAINNLIIFPRARYQSLVKQKKYRQAWGILVDLVRSIRTRKYAAVLDFQGLLKSGILTGLARSSLKLGSPSTYGKMREGAGFFSRQVPLTDPGLHLIDRHALVVRELMGDFSFDREFYLPVLPQDRETLDALLRSKGWGEGSLSVPLILLHPFASWKTRQWPMRFFLDVGVHFLRKGYRVGIIGGGGEEQKTLVAPFREFLEKTEKEEPDINTRMKFFQGELSLRGTAHLMTRAELVIADDSGPMHLASALGVRTLGVFGPTDPVRLGPSYPPGSSSVHLNLLCQPCMKRSCPIGTVCMNDLLPEDVIRAAESLLAVPMARQNGNERIGFLQPHPDH